MGKIVIYKGTDNIYISYDEKYYFFSYEVLNNIINDNGLPCKINLINIDSAMLNKICNTLRKKDLDVRSFNAFTDKNEKNKYIIKVREKVKERGKEK